MAMVAEKRQATGRVKCLIEVTCHQIEHGEWADEVTSVFAEEIRQHQHHDATNLNRDAETESYEKCDDGSEKVAIFRWVVELVYYTEV